MSMLDDIRKYLLQEKNDDKLMAYLNKLTLDELDTMVIRLFGDFENARISNENAKHGIRKLRLENVKMENAKKEHFEKKIMIDNKLIEVNQEIHTIDSKLKQEIKEKKKKIQELNKKLEDFSNENKLLNEKYETYLKFINNRTLDVSNDVSNYVLIKDDILTQYIHSHSKYLFFQMKKEWLSENYSTKTETEFENVLSALQFDKKFIEEMHHNNMYFPIVIIKQLLYYYYRYICVREYFFAFFGVLYISQLTNLLEFLFWKNDNFKNHAKWENEDILIYMVYHFILFIKNENRNDNYYYFDVANESGPNNNHNDDTNHFHFVNNENHNDNSNHNDYQNTNQNQLKIKLLIFTPIVFDYENSGQHRQYAIDIFKQILSMILPQSLSQHKRQHRRILQSFK